MQKDLIFFGENGLTSTSANYTANVAKEFVQSLESEIDGINLNSEYATLISDNTRHCITDGVNREELFSVVDKLDVIACAKSLIAWLREAIKAKERLVGEVKNTDVEEYCEMRGMEFPERPERPDYLTEDEYVSTLSVKERNRYYALETFCSTVGKYIHPDGKLSVKRKAFNKALSNPTTIKGDGRDAIIYKSEPKISKDDLEELFFGLQKKHREAQAELNSIKFKMETALTADRETKMAEFNAKYSDWSSSVKVLENELEKWKVSEVDRVSKLKIVIPNDLKGVYEKVSNLGK